MRRPSSRPTRRSIRRLGAIGVVITILASGFAAAPGPAHADGVSDQQQQVKDDLAEIDRLEQKSAQLNEEYLGYLNQKAELEAEIAVGQQQIDAKQAELTVLQNQLAAVAVQQFTGGGGGGGLALLGDTAGATDSLQRDQLVRTAVDAGAASTDDYNALLGQLSSQNDDLQAKQAKVAKLADQSADALDRTKQAGLDYQAELARDQATLGDLLVQEQARQVAEAAAKHAAEVAQAQADEKAAADRAAAKRAADDQAAQDQAAQSQAAQDQATPSTTSSGTASNNGSSDNNTTSTAAASSKAATSSGAGGDAAASGDQSFGATADATVDTTAATVAAAVNSDSGSNDSASNDSSSNADTSSSNSVDTAPPVSSRAEVAVAAARSQLGVPYQYAMSSPGVAFDCSGLTAYAWSKAGVSIPHQSAMQYASTPHVAVADVQPGDLLYYYSPISHVAIYIGNGMQIHAPAPGKFVEIVSVNWGKVVGASRPG